MQIKKLEETLGVQLIERTNKSVLLTEIGRSITQHARDILNRVDAMKEVAHQASDPLSGTLRVGIIPTLAPYLLPHILPGLSQSLPKLTIYLIEDTTDNLLVKLTEGKIDTAFLALPLTEDNLITLPLFEESFFLAVSIEHPLAKRKKISVSDLENQTLLLLEEGHCLRDQALKVCRQTSVVEATDFRATSLETLKQMVIFNAGVTLVPQLSTQPHPAIAYIPFVAPQPKRSIGIVYRSSTAKKRVLENIAIQIKKIMTKHSMIKK